MESVRVTVRLTEEEAEAMREAAQYGGVTLSDVAAEAVREWLRSNGYLI